MAGVTVNLPSSPSDGQEVKVKDASGDAGTNNITITGTIDGTTNLVISSDYGAASLEYNGTEWSIMP